MTNKEKLAEMLMQEIYGGAIIGTEDDIKHIREGFIKVADHLIANGVVVQKRGWIKVYQNAMYPYSCSECGNCHARKVNFCERCGTKLDLPQPPKEGE